MPGSTDAGTGNAGEATKPCTMDQTMEFASDVEEPPAIDFTAVAEEEEPNEFEFSGKGEVQDAELVFDEELDEDDEFEFSADTEDDELEMEFTGDDEDEDLEIELSADDEDDELEMEFAAEEDDSDVDDPDSQTVAATPGKTSEQ